MKQTFMGVVLGILRFVGISLLIAIGLFLLVTLSFLIWGPLTATAYSERMFWVGFGATICGMPAVLSSLGTNQGYYNSPFTAGLDAQVAHTIVKDGRKGLTRRTKFAWRMFSIGAFGISFAALIDLISKR
jgi:hypothetical protein